MILLRLKINHAQPLSDTSESTWALTSKSHIHASRSPSCSSSNHLLVVVVLSPQGFSNVFTRDISLRAKPNSWVNSEEMGRQPLVLFDQWFGFWVLSGRRSRKTLARWVRPARVLIPAKMSRFPV